MTRAQFALWLSARRYLATVRAEAAAKRAEARREREEIYRRLAVRRLNG